MRPFIDGIFPTIKPCDLRGGKVFDHENEQPAHRGPAIVFSEILCIEWVGVLIGWSGKNIKILILYDRYYLSFCFFEFIFISLSFNSFVYIFSLLFIISASSQYKFFLVGFFFSVPHHFSPVVFFFQVDNRFLFFKYKFIYFNWRLITLQYCIGFAIHQHESATGISVGFF